MSPLAAAGLTLAAVAVLVYVDLRDPGRVMPTYDQARQFGKAYVGRPQHRRPRPSRPCSPRAPRCAWAGRPPRPTAVRDATPPGRSGFRRARLDPPDVLLTVRVLDRAAASVDDRVHRLRLDERGRITALEA